MTGVKKSIRKEMYDRQLWIRRICLMIIDCLLVTLAGFFTLFLRFEMIWSAIDPEFIKAYLRQLPLELALALILFWIFRLYHSLWAYAGAEELLNIVMSAFLLMVGDVLIVLFVPGYLPRSFYPLTFLLITAMVGGVRLLYRYLRRMRGLSTGPKETKNVMIIGAGRAGLVVAKEYAGSSHLHGKVCCMIDDDRKKIGNYIHGIKVVGGREMIRKAAIRYEIDQIIIAMPSESKKTISQILEICQDTKCELKILPGIYQLMNDEVNVTKIRDVEIGDLLGRDQIVVDSDAVHENVFGKRILVTGGGGSIGSELCRQIASHNPSQLIIFDIYENNAYAIQQELKHNYPELDLVVLIGSVRNTSRINSVFEQYRPQIVFHAAAHKHVPLMETSPDEAVKNNVFGTLKTVQAADKYGAEKFVMISTDKAVNPTNVMGATKRICEMIIQTWNKRSKTDYVAVRFGNVLGSNGSVIPLFKKQIEQRGPITVTHPDIIRYFMTIPEAVGLVLTAATYAEGGEIFVLDMGEPVKIVDLAKNMIRLSGLKLGDDIDIVYTGLRPGEKLYEELLMEEEGLKNTANEKIFIGAPIELDETRFEEELEELKAAANSESTDIRCVIQKLVPTYHPGDEAS